jgi:putative FmdB family regulatory protein
MPVYQYRCPSCDGEYEEKRSFARSDEPSICPGCGATAVKVFSAATFYAPGSAAKAMLEPKAPTRRVPVAHGADCPCCSGARTA